LEIRIFKAFPLKNEKVPGTVARRFYLYQIRGLEQKAASPLGG
jgi:hypothetical protein